MGNLISNAYIAKPPISVDFINKAGAISREWINWLNSITEITGYVIGHDYLLNAGGSGVQADAPVLQLISYTTAERDRLQNAIARSDSGATNKIGTVIYNTTNNRPEFAMNGGWFTFTPVAA